MKKMGKLTLVFALMIFFFGTAMTVQAVDIVKIDINKATAKEFTKLNKIGPKIAENIIEYRKINGPFKTIEDLMKVKGIGKAIFKLNKDQIVVNDKSDNKAAGDNKEAPKKADSPKKSD